MFCFLALLLAVGNASAQSYVVDPLDVLFFSQGYENITEKDQGQIDFVKNSTLRVDPSITLGKAFDSYDGFSKTMWFLLNDKKGRQIVQVAGVVDLKKFKKKCGKFWPPAKDRLDNLICRVDFVLSADMKSFDVRKVIVQSQSKRQAKENVYSFDDIDDMYPINEFLKRIYDDGVPIFCM